MKVRVVELSMYLQCVNTAYRLARMRMRLNSSAPWAMEVT